MRLATRRLWHAVAITATIAAAAATATTAATAAVGHRRCSAAYLGNHWPPHSIPAALQQPQRREVCRCFLIRGIRVGVFRRRGRRCCCRRCCCCIPRAPARYLRRRPPCRRGSGDGGDAQRRGGAPELAEGTVHLWEPAVILLHVHGTQLVQQGGTADAQIFAAHVRHRRHQRRCRRGLLARHHGFACRHWGRCRRRWRRW